MCHNALDNGQRQILPYNRRIYCNIHIEIIMKKLLPILLYSLPKNNKTLIG